MPLAMHVVKENLPRTLPKVSFAQGRDSPATPQLPADDVCFWKVPEVITHSPPDSLVEEFYTARTAPVVACQPHGGPASWGRKRKQGDTSHLPCPLMAVVYNLASVLIFLELPAYAITPLHLLHKTYGIFLFYILFQDSFTVRGYLQR